MRKVRSIITIMIAMIVGIAFSSAAPVEVSAAVKTPAKVSITAIKSTDYNTVKITWKKASNAKKYEVYRATSKGGTYKKQTTTSKLSYVNAKLTTGKTYYYKVRAINGNKKGKFSSVKSVVPKLKIVTNLKATAQSYSSCKVSWDKVNGAKTYQIYRSSTNKTGSFKLIKTTSERSYVNTGLTTGKKYYYKVRAARDSKKGEFSSVKSATPMLSQVKGVNVEASSYTSALITWDKVSGATGYKIYRATSKTGTYSLLKTIKEASFEDVKLTQGKTYYYKVRAYRTVNGKAMYSAYSTVKSIYMQPREIANKFTYTVSASDEMIYVENKIFSNDVMIQGDNGNIAFINCEFKTNIVLAAEVGTRVWLIDGTNVSGQCILDNGIKEGTFESSLPKFMTQTSIDVVAEDNYGAVWVVGDAKVTFNGTEYGKDDCDYYYTPEGELVEYTGQTGEGYYGVAQWWENEKHILMIMCE